MQRLEAGEWAIVERGVPLLVLNNRREAKTLASELLSRGHEVQVIAARDLADDDLG